VITLGVGAETQDGASRALTLSQFGPFPDTAEYERSTRSAYAQVVATPTPRLTLTGGARVDDGDRFGTFGTWRAGASLRPGAWVVRAAAGSAFKEPTFYENFAQGFVIGNPALDPERSFSAELGVERAIGSRVRIAATAYTQQFRDLIQYTFAPTRQGESNYFNLGEARARGIETSAAFAIAERWQLDAAYDWLQTEVLESGDEGDLTFVAGSRLLRRPEHRIAGALAWTGDAARATLTLTHVGEREDLDFSNPEAFSGERVTIDAYTLINVSGEVPLGRAFTGTLRVENVTGAEYEEVVGFPARGRTVYVGLRAAFGS
jgi:vitamin B12 transporter